MKQLAELAFEHMWLMLFGSDDRIDPDYAVKLQENLSVVLERFEPTEAEALAEVARKAKARMLAEPDEYGYTRRSLVTQEERDFLDSVISKEIFRSSELGA